MMIKLRIGPYIWVLQWHPRKLKGRFSFRCNRELILAYLQNLNQQERHAGQSRIDGRKEHKEVKK